MNLRPAAIGVFALLVTAGFGQNPQRPDWHDSWDATEVMIPMRDGVKLHTVYFVPKHKTGPFPILLERTPYGSGTAKRPPQRSTPAIDRAGYILAWQDVRGTGDSEGTFINVRPILPKGKPGCDESTDCYDTVDYLVKHVPQNNHAVGLWGISYPGFYAGAGGMRNHPDLKAISPQAPVNDWFLGDDDSHRGAFFMQETFDFLLFFDAPKDANIRVDRGGLSAYDFYLKAGALSNFNPKFLQNKVPYWNELMEHDTYDSYWKDRALWRSFKDVGCPVLTVGGLFDKEDMWGAQHLYRAGEANGVKDNFLVLGPWYHGQWADFGGSNLAGLAFGMPTSKWYQDNVELPFFERYLRGNSTVPAPAKATVFETGVNRWQTFAEWPPKVDTKPIYLQSNRALSWAKPYSESAIGYTYDPAAPTPYLEQYQTSKGAPADWLARNQAFLDSRTDNATFRMPVLTDDLRIGGPIKADLWVETTGTDADFVVQVIDEYPADTTDKTPRGDSMAGYQLMVRGEIRRAKFRDSWEKPSAITPNTPTHVTFDLNDCLHTFRKGHRIVIRVQSSWFPIADRNPNTFVSRLKATDADFHPADIKILCGGGHASHVDVGVLRP